MQILGFLDVNINTEMKKKLLQTYRINPITKHRIKIKKNVLSIPFQISFRVQLKSIF